METIKRTKIADVLKRTDFGAIVNVKGWVRTRRGSKAVNFIALNDGSTIKNVQIVVDVEKFDENIIKEITTGACISVNGELVQSQGAGQSVELQCREIEILGTCGADYPLQKKGHTMEFLREHANLRMRTNTFGAVFRIRHNMAMAIHQYFHEHGFVYLNTPIITASDCEGAGNMFQVTTKNLYDLKKNEEGKIIYDDDFFGQQTSLTVSGQLEGELGATALGAIYTFGPTFRAENSNTPRHLAEFWMVEPEVAFLDQEELMNLEEDFIKYCVRWALDNCKDDLEFLNKMIDKTLIQRLESVLKDDFVRLPYTKGIEILQEAIKKGKKFEFPCNWGDDLASEHERYLVEEHFKKPVIMTDYPTAIKAFYMKQNAAEGEGSVGYKGCVAPGPTMQGTDVLFPQIGEIIGGSVREESYDKLMSEINRRQMETDKLWWYLETRKWGSCPHAGFGLGFERLILFVTGMQNIRDVIPFPRTPKNAEF
ncbi:MAG: asparagine--tRNA ligase [Prevotella sp.]|nr:asparagine--tRNA ligase [Prevotella sp.]MEE1091912.1 asparagine--tRNA ligase [Prevotella sp.]